MTGAMCGGPNLIDPRPCNLQPPGLDYSNPQALLDQLSGHSLSSAALGTFGLEASSLERN